MNSHYVSTLNNKFVVSQNDPKEVYRKPIPIDTINKFWGVDSKILKHDETVQKQSFDQSYKNFWSFVDFNSAFMMNEKFLEEKFVTSSNSKTKNSKVSVSYEEARRRANQQC